MSNYPSLRRGTDASLAFEAKARTHTHTRFSPASRSLAIGSAHDQYVRVCAGSAQTQVHMPSGTVLAFPDVPASSTVDHFKVRAWAATVKI